MVAQKNRVRSASGNGIDVTSSGEPRTNGKTPTNVVVRRNTVHGAQLSGLHLALGTKDVKQHARHRKVKKQRPSDPCSCGLLSPPRI